MLKHKAVFGYSHKCFELFTSFKKGGTIRTWLNAVERLTEDIENEDDKNKFRGDMLEILAEIFFTIFHADEGVGVKEYTPVSLEEDYGVDAIGVNVNGHRIAVQVKYRGNPVDLIPYADLTRTYTSAQIQFEIDMKDHTLYLFTTARGVSYACSKMLQKRLVVINRNILSTKIDNNKTFWGRASEMIFEVLDT